MEKKLIFSGNKIRFQKLLLRMGAILSSEIDEKKELLKWI